MASSDANSLQLYFRLLSHVKPYWVPFALSIIGMMVTALTEPAFPALLKPLLDGSFVHKEGGLLQWLPALIVGLFLVRGIASYASDPFDGREHGGLVFRARAERNFFIGRLSLSQQKKWLRDHPERWKTREDALRDLQARAGTEVDAEPPEARSTTSANEVRPNGEVDGPSPAPAEDKRPPDKPPMNAAPLTIANAEATATADDEITIGEPRFIIERRVAVMLEKSQRQLQRWRNEQKGPASTKIGRRLFYELNTLQEWIERKKKPVNAGGSHSAPRRGLASIHQLRNPATF